MFLKREILGILDSMNKYPIGCVQMHLDLHRTDFIRGETYNNSITFFGDWVPTNRSYIPLGMPRESLSRLLILLTYKQHLH
jgi:hypothetical protein